MATNNFNWPAKPDNPVLNRAHPLAQKLILDVNYVARGGKSEIERVTGAGTATIGTTAGVSNNGSVRVFPGSTATDVDVITNRGLFTDPNRLTLECVVLLNTGGGNGLGRIVDGPFMQTGNRSDPISVAADVYHGTDFRAKFGGPGADYAALGDAGNYAYGAMAARLGIPLGAAEIPAGIYSLATHPTKDWGWPYGMDPSAREQIPKGYIAGWKKP